MNVKGVNMSKYWNELTQSLEPYIPGEQPKDKKYIKLNTNENPYPPSPKVIAAINKATDDTLRLYPDPNCDELRQTAASYYNLSTEEVFIGNGSDEVLAFAFMTFFSNKKPVFFADITYSFYKVYANLCNLEPKIIPLDDEFKIPVDEFCVENGGIVIPCPNAPTGESISVEGLKKILDYSKDSVVIVDEAYIDFGGESMTKYINEYPNLLVVHTLSKSRALAGLRVGFAMGHKDLIEGLNRVKNSFNSYTLDRLALVGANAAIEDDEYFKEISQKIINTREITTRRLRELNFNVLPSKANFVFISHPQVGAKTLFQELRNRGILVRYFNQPRIDNFLRVTIGTDEEMSLFIDALREILSKASLE
jgi:histidinol-phosphate aminotransferase